MSLQDRDNKTRGLLPSNVSANELLPPRERTRASPDHILDRISAILAAYRKDELADADGWTSQVAKVLEHYPREVIDYVSDPITGVQSYVKWGVPNVADITEACSDRIAKLTADFERRRPLALPPPVDRSKRLTMDELRAKFGPTWGLKTIDDEVGKAAP
jgi:hypothetical protein